MDLALNNLQKLICHKTHTTDQLRLKRHNSVYIEANSVKVCLCVFDDIPFFVFIVFYMISLDYKHACLCALWGRWGWEKETLVECG